MRPGASTICRIERAVTLLPDPLSPTTQSVLPRCRVRDTPSTALTTPLRVGKWVARSRTVENGVGRRGLARSAAGGELGDGHLLYGSAASRNPSPRKLRAITAITTATPGAKSQGAVAMERMFCASRSSTPHEMVGG